MCATEPTPEAAGPTVATFQRDRGPPLTDSHPTSIPPAEAARPAAVPACAASKLQPCPHGSRPDASAGPVAVESWCDRRQSAAALTDAVPLPEDLRALLDVADRHFAARLAMELFCFRLARDLGAICTAVEGDAGPASPAPADDLGDGPPRSRGAIQAQLLACQARLGTAIDALRQRLADPTPADGD